MGGDPLSLNTHWAACEGNDDDTYCFYLSSFVQHFMAIKMQSATCDQQQ